MPKPGQMSVTLSGRRMRKLWAAYNRAKKKEKDPCMSFASFLSKAALRGIEQQQEEKREGEGKRLT